jgi:putative two-component system response regulator
VGKVGIPDVILRKPGKLTTEEFATMKKHTRIGDAVLKRSPKLAVARLVAKSHHEHWDGAGYPDGLVGEAIPLAARIVAVVDVFDALVSQRPYKECWPVQRAASQVEAGVGTHFDPVIASTFLRLYAAGEFDDLVQAAIEDANKDAKLEISS